MKRFRAAIALAVILLALGGIATWDEWKTKKDDKAKEQANKVLSFAPEQISELKFVNSPGLNVVDPAGKPDESAGEPVSVHLVKQAGSWTITEPFTGSADETSVTSLLTTLKDYKYESVVTSDRGRWKDFGLDPVRRTIQMFYTADAKPQTFTLYIGNKSPVGYGVYFATDRGNDVFIGSQHLATSTNKTLMDFRDKSLVKIDERSLKTFGFENVSFKAEFAKDANGKYVFTNPKDVVADADAVESFISDVIRAKTPQFIDQPTAAQIQAFVKPKKNAVGAVVQWSYATGSPQRILFAELDKKLYAATEPVTRLLLVPDDLKPKILDKKLTDFRDRKIFNFNSRDIKSISINGDQFRNVKGQWYTASDADKVEKAAPEAKDLPAAKSHVLSLLIDMENAKADTFEPLEFLKKLPKAPRDHVELGFAMETKKPALKIDVWGDATDKTKVYVRHSEGQYVFRAPQSAFANLTETSAKSGTPPGKLSQAPVEINQE